MAEERVHFSREFIFPERERERSKKGFKRSEEFKSAENFREGEEKCVLGIYPLLLDTPQWLS